MQHPFFGSSSVHSAPGYLFFVGAPQRCELEARGASRIFAKRGTLARLILQFVLFLGSNESIIEYGAKLNHVLNVSMVVV